MSVSRSLISVLVLVGAQLTLMHAAETVAAGVPAPLVATGHFVDCQSGNDANAGTSAANPWKTVSMVNRSISATGADVWFKTGTTCTEPLTVDWNGTADDHAIIGSYYVSSGTAYRLTPDNPTAFPTEYTWSNGVRATLRGTYNASCSKSLSGGKVNPSTCAVNEATAIPKSEWTPMISLSCDYCDAQSMRMLDSAGRGISVGPSPGTNAFVHSTHRIIDNDIGPTAQDALDLQGTHHDFVSGNTFHDSNVGTTRGDGLASFGAPTVGNFAPEVIGGTASVYNDIDTLLEKNSFINGWGEGLIISQVGHVIVRGNRLSGSGAVGGIYTQTCSKCVYEYNLIWGGKPTDHTAATGYGIGIVAEDAYGKLPETDIIIRGNMVAHSSNCIIVDPEAGNTAAEIRLNIRAYNNTCVDMTEGILVRPSLTAANIGAVGIHFRNNIGFNESGAKTLCAAPRLTNVDFDYNLWGSIPDDSDCRGTHDTTPGNPLLTGSNFTTKTSYTTPPSIADFVLRAGSPARHSGTPLVSTILSVVDYPVSTNMAYPCTTFDLKGSSIDAACADRAATSPNLGALEGEGNQASNYVLTID